MKDELLKPCPFCEGPPVAIVTRAGHLGGGVFGEDQIPEDGMDAEGYVFCHECGADGPKAEDIVYDDDDIEYLRIVGVLLWQSRDSRHRGLYDGSVENGSIRRVGGGDD